jgi:hypothetical protein
MACQLLFKVYLDADDPETSGRSPSMACIPDEHACHFWRTFWVIHYCPYRGGDYTCYFSPTPLGQALDAKIEGHLHPLINHFNNLNEELWKLTFLSTPSPQLTQMRYSPDAAACLARISPAQPGFSSNQHRSTEPKKTDQA